MYFMIVVGFVLLLGGPIGTYLLVRHYTTAQRWQLIAWCTAGGAVAGILYNVAALLTGLIRHPLSKAFLQPASYYLAEYALFGLVLGFAAVIPRAAGLPRVVVTGLVMYGVLVVVGLAMMRAHEPRDGGPSGIVFGPDSAPAVGAPVFLDRGFGEVERLTTDATGLFRARLRPKINSHAMLLICVRGGIPFVSHPIGNSLTPARFQIAALPHHSIVEPGIRAFGWQKPVPHECLGDAEPGDGT